MDEEKVYFESRDCFVIKDLERNEYVGGADIFSANRYKNLKEAKKYETEYINEHWRHIPTKIIPIRYECKITIKE